ncbi:MAG: hypothetical protein EA376_06970 [Phycisphaeraceae bacterium]|nr:MAG: hypothetical protein EA376_06970 [Phycisphaeraceae bacterium]
MSALALIGSAQIVVAHPIYVDSNATGAESGLSWTDAFTNLQSALAAARTDGDVTEIRVAYGVYTPDVGPGFTAGDRAAAFEPAPDVAMLGGYAGVLDEDPDHRDTSVFTTTLSGAIGKTPEEGSFTVVLIDGVEGVSLDGFVITGGFADIAMPQDQIVDGPPSEGGGVFIAEASPVFIDCRIVGNHARRGGGVGARDASPSFTRVRFSENTAGEGAGLYAEGGDALLTDVRFIGNSADFGAGALLHEASAAVANTIFTGNTARFRGGAMLLLPGGQVDIEAGAFRDNQAENGGAILNDGADVRIVNTVFGANAAEHSGGAVLHRNGSLKMINCAIAGNQSSFGGAVSARSGAELINCTISNNEASQQNGTAFGGGFIGGGLRIFDAGFELRNTILSGNAAPVGAQAAIRESQAVLDVAYSYVEGQSGGVVNSGGAVMFGAGNLIEGPVFAAALPIGEGAGTSLDNLRLAPGSPGIDAGDSTVVPADVMFDLDGAPRFRDDPDTPDTGVIGDAPAVVDLGAWEFRGGETSCAWDLTGDGSVGTADLGVLLSGWGVSFGATDLAGLLNAWGPCP